MRRVLVVEDNAELAEGIAYNLGLEGLDVRVAENGAAGLKAFRLWNPDVVILDLMLPDTDGYDVLREIRRAPRRVPVMILTARADESDKVRGFRLDADQYVIKPFGLLELIERVKSLLRRAADDNGGEHRFGDIVVDTEAHTVTRRGEPVPLTPRAFELLVALIRREGAAVSRLELLREVWGHKSEVLTRTVDAHIAELRRKLEDDAAEPRHILTVWKVGYRLQA